MPRSDLRRNVLRVCWAAPVCVICAYAWCAILSFDAADPPGATVWPTNSTPQNWCGAFGAALAHGAFYYLGLGVYPLLVLASLGAAAGLRGLQVTDFWLRVAGAALLCVAFACAGAMLIPPEPRYGMSGAGGVLGATAGAFFASKLGQAGATIVLAASLVVGLLLAADELVIRFGRWLMWALRRSAPVVVRGGSVLADAGAAVASGVANVSGRLATAGGQWNAGSEQAADAEAAPAGRAPKRAAAERGATSEPGATPKARGATLRDAEPPAAATAQKSAGAAAPRADDEAPDIRSLLPSALVVKPAASTVAANNPQTPMLPGLAPGPAVRDLGRSASGERVRPLPPKRETGDYELPNLSILEEPTPIDKAAIELLCREKAYVLEQTLNEFKLDVRVVAIETGPVITVFELKLAAGIKVSQIVSLSNDLARALKAPAVRVVAPLPGKNTIGIEVPNTDKEKVRLKDIIVASAARAQNYAIPLYLGKDASGQPLVNDLTAMPHLLIAGTTGSGKSVCVASIIMSILLTRTPDEVNLILVDPKVVELSIFKDVPHLMCPIITETSKAEAILDWATTKMDERYELLAEVGVKDIRSYNKLGIAGLRERLQPADEQELATIPVYLPYIVIVIDELADLMMTSAKEVEFYLSRLAQKSRAVGIHLIVSTQRPQANVVTGLIKSNLPSRIAFRVASRLDSRIVLDQNGGEVLMGQGDMLFLPPGSHKLVRAQGTYIADEELRGVVKHVRAQREPNFHPELTRSATAAATEGERDELFDQAVDIVLETGRGSVSLLQRRLTIGYGRASRLVEDMARAGIVGDYKGSQAREVQITREEWLAIKAQRNREEAAEASAADDAERRRPASPAEDPDAAGDD